MSAPRNIVEGDFSFDSEKKMPAAKKTAFVVFVVLFLMTGVAATQVTAHYAGYSPRLLGEPLFRFGRYKTPVYSPLMMSTWAGVLMRDAATKPVAQKGLLVLLVGIMLDIAICRGIVGKSGNGRLSTLHGTAHWATRKDIEQAGLLPKKGQKDDPGGVYVGGWYDKRAKKLRYLRDTTMSHDLVFAPTGSGKGVGLVLPTLFGWPHSCIILDIKQENWELTAGWRQKEGGSHVIRLDPSDVSGNHATFNPLNEIRLGTVHETADAQNIASMIVDPDGKGMADHWSKTSFDLLTGTILHCMYRAANQHKKGRRDSPCASMYEIVSELSDPDKKDFKEIFAGWLEYGHYTDANGNPTPNPEWDNKPLHPAVKQAAADMIGRDDREGSSVLSSAKSYLTLYRDPILIKNTRVSSFRIMDLMNADKPVSLYLTIKPADLDRLRPFIRLFLTQVVKILANEMEYTDGESKMLHKYPLLLLLDEFPQLGRLEVIEKGVSYTRSYGLKFYLITQDLNQLYKAYTKEEAFSSNCPIRIAYAPNKVETAEMLSKMSGTTTAEMTTESISGEKGGFGMGKKTSSIQVQGVQRPLLTVDECMRLPGAIKEGTGKIVKAGSMLIFSQGFAPVMGRQILYFLDPVFRERSKVPAPKKSDVIRQAGTANPADPAADREAEVKSSPIQKIFSDDSVQSRYDIDSTLIAEEDSSLVRAEALAERVRAFTPDERMAILRPLMRKVVKSILTPDVGALE